MNDDRGRLLEAFKGDEPAVSLVFMLVEVADVWDNLVDNDPVSIEQINRAFWVALVEIPRNQFYAQHAFDLQPMIATAIINWQTANQLERQDRHAREIAHVLRYSVADIVTFMLLLIGGHEWAQQWAPELRLRSQKDHLENYLAEMEEKYGPCKDI